MNMDKFDPFIETLKSRYNLILVLVGIALVADMYLGSPALRQVVFLQLKIMKIDPSRGGFRIISIFGTFTSVDQVAKIFDKAGIIICFCFAGISFLRGFIESLMRK